jgi:hypothetical protein
MSYGASTTDAIELHSIPASQGRIARRSRSRDRFGLVTQTARSAAIWDRAAVQPVVFDGYVLALNVAGFRKAVGLARCT